MSTFLKILIISVVLKTFVKSKKYVKKHIIFIMFLSILENVVFPWREQELYCAEPVETIPTILLSVSENIDYFIGFICKNWNQRNEKKYEFLDLNSTRWILLGDPPCSRPKCSWYTEILTFLTFGHFWKEFGRHRFLTVFDQNKIWLPWNHDVNLMEITGVFVTI